MFLGASAGSRTGEPRPTGSGTAGGPEVNGGLDGLLVDRPVFRLRLNGYDRLEVDNYAAWAEEELLALRRQVGHLMTRVDTYSQDLEATRRRLAAVPPARDAFPVSERLQQMVQLATDEAAALTEAGATEAEQIVAEARTEADARLRKAQEIKEMAVDSAGEILAHARRERTAATAQVQSAADEAAALLRAAAAERDRLAQEAVGERQRAVAATTAELATVQVELEELRRQRAQARQSVRRLIDGMDQTLRAVADEAPRDDPSARKVHTVMVDNVVADVGPPEDLHDGPAEAAPGGVRLAGRPARVSS